MSRFLYYTCKQACERWPASTRQFGISLVQLRFPDVRHATARPRHRLVLGMRMRSGQRRTVHEFFRRVIVEPVFSRLPARDDRVSRRVEIRRRMLLRRVIAASDVSALRASAYMEPPAVLLRTFQATGARFRMYIDAVDALDQKVLKKVWLKVSAALTKFAEEDANRAVSFGQLDRLWSRCAKNKEADVSEIVKDLVSVVSQPTPLPLVPKLSWGSLLTRY